MKLVKADRKELERGSRERSPRSVFADEAIDEFLDMGSDCVKVEGFEDVGTTSQISVSVRNRLSSRKLKGIKCVTRRGNIYIYKEEADD